MATANDTRFAELKARVEATGHKLFRGAADDTFYILDPSDERLLAVDLTYETIEREIKYLQESTAEDAGNDDPEDVERDTANIKRDEDGVAEDGSVELDPGGDPDGEGNRFQYHLLFNRSGRAYDIIPGIRGIALQFYESPMFDDLPENAQGLAYALRVLADKLYDCGTDVLYEINNRVRLALERPDSDRAAMEKRLRGTGHSLWCHPSLPNSYAVMDDFGVGKLSVVSLGEVEAWMKREGIERKKGGAA